MLRWRRVGVLTLWLLSLLAASRWSAAETQPNPLPPQQSDAQVVSGADVGVMVFPGTNGQGRPVGTLVIRRQGQWVPVELATSVTPGDSRGRLVPLR